MSSDLYAHQQKIIDDDKPVAGLFMGTGSGKTRTALMLAKGLIIVICPKTQKEDGNWERELKILKRKDNATLTILSKEEFRRDWESLPECDTLIVDEAHTCLGVTPNIRYVKRKPIPKTSQLFEALGMYIMRTKPKRLYLCTATPIRSPMTVWAAAKLLGQKWDWYKFRDKFYIRLPMPGREIFQAKTDTAAKNRLGELVRKLGYTGQLSDYFDVPEQTYKTIYVNLTKEQRTRIGELKFEYPDPLVRCGKIHQAENGVLSGDEFNDFENFPTEKLDKIEDFIVEFPRLLIFAKYIAQIEQIATLARSIGKKVLILIGATKERGQVISEANSSKECVVIAQSQLSSGWQLGKTKEHPEYYDYNYMVFASMDYQVVNRIQAEGRILRSDNLKKNLYITLVTRGGVDEAVMKCIENKKDFHEKMYA